MCAGEMLGTQGRDAKDGAAGHKERKEAKEEADGCGVGEDPGD